MKAYTDQRARERLRYTGTIRFTYFNIVGEFNNWSFTANPMKRLKDGAFTATLDLEKGEAYQFRYVLDENQWKNEAEADKFVRSPYGDSDNSVIIV